MSKNQKNVVAKRMQDPKNSSVTLVQYAPIVPGRPKKGTTVVLCSVCNKPFSVPTSLDSLTPVCAECTKRAMVEPEKEEKRRREEELNSHIHKTCKICGKAFYIKASKVEQLKANGMELFACCYACQKAKQSTEPSATE